MAATRSPNNEQAELSPSRANNVAPLTPRAPASHSHSQTASSPLIQRAQRFNRSSTLDPVVNADGNHAYTKHILCEAVDANQDPLDIRPFVDAAISSYPSSRKPEIYGDLVKQGPKLHALVSEVRQRLNTAPERVAEMDRKMVELDQAWGASDDVWLPVEFRAGKGVRDLDKLNKLLRVTKLAISNSVSLLSLWQPGGPLWESLTGNPPKFTREAGKSAIERLRQDLLRTHGVNSRASELGSELRNLAPDAIVEDAAESTPPDHSPQTQSNHPDSDSADPEMGRRMPTFSADPDISDPDVSLGKDIATPHKGARDQSPAISTRSLDMANYQYISDDEDGDEAGKTKGQMAQHAARRLLEQLQADACLTDDVLHLLCCFTLASHDIGSSESSRPHLLDPLWFHTKTPSPRMPSFLLDVGNHSARAVYLPIHLDYNHWVLCRVLIDGLRATISIYDSLLRHPSQDRISKSLEQWFSQTLPSLQLEIITPACSQQSDYTSCGIFVVMTLERLLRNQSVTDTIQVFNERQRLLRLLLSEDSRHLALNDLQLETLSAVRELRPALKPQQRSTDETLTKSNIPRTTAHNADISSNQPTCAIEPVLEMGDRHEPIDLSTCNDFHPSACEMSPARVGIDQDLVGGCENADQSIPQSQSSDIPTCSLEAPAKRKISQEQEDIQGTGNKKLCSLDSADLSTLSDHFLRALHRKTASAVSSSAAHLQDAEMALSQAEGTLQVAKGAVEAAELLKDKSGGRTARFQQWLEKAPSEDQDPDFEDAIVSATKASQAYLDQYSFRVHKRIAAAKHDLVEATQEVERCSSVVIECKRHLQVAQSKEEEFKNIEGVVERLVTD
ncbi:uncharacterized protein NECHADRAFT_89412 [Fusarium vanettenii 77-13-4]|uniref:Ubiquitin-like protease family profile domain-containing protein n=1 Tax=Fusarium vanettenii (strain ATCC MYA-4622 / CBS 123669 / FGSC 9596 / NRRL 45880 / 77-13-4) TaxID=660122 RepID=C7ZR44_FUSV7|nr:uncharacterized protein NECHADRAFT_89412 [Fusarium vanettenii 77-13-4]EEU33510.1 predicted protein [Fusarium vanettenii 77-13-4]